ncbi:MAG: nucleotidyltransferase domain-containing protein [Spirochaeta sp.]|jgi:predicted nucleotidyltransferase|nr:nucleotidyltransferase domain-containing protein [Spirochaeta sp.]
METGVREAIRSIKSAFPVSNVYVFGSYARGEERPDSDIDVLVVCTEMPPDLFDLTYQIRKHLHERVDIALDVMVTTDHEFEKRGSQPWTVEYTAKSEGIAV